MSFNLNRTLEPLQIMWRTIGFEQDLNQIKNPQLVARGRAITFNLPRNLV